jgi:citrate lyase beta subunit
VPAIDNMTVNYPVAKKGASDAENRAHVLARLKECFDDAKHGARLGMDGKWVGHPAQLFACLVAFRSVYPKNEIDAEVRKIEAYEKAVQAELGATIIEGVMSDRATDRHARARLRKATALGIIDAARATALGIITESEAKELTSG